MSEIDEGDKSKGEAYRNPNGMPMALGKTLHMDCGVGDIANRIVTVGTESRAEKLHHILMLSLRRNASRAGEVS